MKRRSFLQVLGGLLVAPLAAKADCYEPVEPAIPSPDLVKRGLAVDVYESDFGISLVDTDAYKRAQELRNDMERSFLSARVDMREPDELRDRLTGITDFIRG